MAATQQNNLNYIDTQRNATSTTQGAPGVAAMSPVTPDSPLFATDRRGSAEWDASKVPPSKFQRRKGSIYAVPNSRDGRVDNNYAAKFHELHREKGYDKQK